MVTMPGTPVETYDPNSSEAAVKPKPPYKPEMGVQVKPGENPYDAFQGDTDLAERANVADVGWKERFTQWFSASQDYGTPGVDELKDIQSAEQGYVNGVGIGPEAGKATADLMRSRRADRQFAFENMKPAETIGDYAAAVSGAVAGAVLDPASALQAPVKIGTAGWRMAYPMLSRLLESGTSNAAMNAAINGVVQAEEYGAGVRDEVDWLSLGVDAAAGFGFGLPFGYADGRAARDFYAQEAAQAAPAAPAAAQPAAPVQPPEPPQGLDVPTSDQMRAEYTAAELSQAQVDLFGEVVGTRNMTPEQIAQLDDYLNGGKAADIPQAPPETQGGLTNDAPPTSVRDAFKEADAAPVEAPTAAAPPETKPNLSTDPATVTGTESVPALQIGGKYFTGQTHAEALDKAITQFGADSPEIKAFEAADNPLDNIGVIRPKQGWIKSMTSGRPEGFAPGITGGNPKELTAQIEAARQGPDLSSLPDSAIKVLPDIPMTAGGNFPLARFTQEEQDALRAAGLVTSETNTDGVTFEAVDPNPMWAERTRRAEAARAEGPKPVTLEEKRAAAENRASLFDQGALDAEAAGDAAKAADYKAKAAEIRAKAPPPPPLPIDRTERQFSPSELKVDAKRFQFKEGGDEAGVTDRLKGVKKWDPIKSGVTLVWEDLNGDFYIADGHQRHGLASRLEKEGQDPKIRAVVLREADGVSAEDARAIAAAKNIAEGTGNAIDAAKILRSRPDMGVDLPPTSALVRDAQGLASLSDDAFGMVINKKVPAGYAAQVGRLAPDPKTHAQLLELLAKEQPDNAIEAESMIRDALEAPAVQSTMEDMFGSAEVTQILFKERAQVLSAAATAIRKDRAAFATLVKEEARLTGAGNKLATQTNAERAAQDAEILATLQAQARRKGPVADALAAAAKQLKDGTSRQVVVRDFLDQLRRPSEATGADGGSPGAPGREGETGIAASLGGYRSTDQPAFRKWFGDSKVVDERGDPLIVYHGAPDGRFVNETGVFMSLNDRYGAQEGVGVFWFARDKSTASSYADDRRAFDYQNAEPRVIPAYLKLENPLVVDGGGKQWREAQALGKTTDVIEKAKAEGHDGVIIRNVLDNYNNGPKTKATDTYVVFNSRQIKSIFNRGTWDATEPNIAFARRPRVDQGPSLFDAMPKAPGISPQMERVLTMSSGKMGAPDNIYGDQINEAVRNGWIAMQSGYTATGNSKTRYFITDAGRQVLAGGQPQPKPVERPTSMPERQAAFREEVERLRAEKAELERSIFAAIDKDGAFSAETADGRTIIVTKSLRDPSLYQITNIDRNGEATGHFDSRGTDLASDVRSTGVKLGVKPRAEAPPPSGGLFDTGADNKPQAVIPGAGKISDKRLAEMRAAAPLKAQRPQKSMDVGLFSDEADQQGFAFSAPNHPPATQVEMARAFQASQPARSFDELYDGGILQRRQDELVEAGKQIAEELGITFKNPGIKKRDTAEKKMPRKGYTSTAKLQDLVRAGFEVDSPDKADALVQRLADYFDVLDEGWASTPHGYFDRKVAVRFYDGTIGEIQVWEPQLAYAKMKRGGTELYTQSRDMPPGPERDRLEQAMVDLYQPIRDSLSPDWSASVGTGGKVPNVLEKRSTMAASSGSTRADAPTSTEFTSVQGSPGSNTDQARPSVQSAGRASQSQNLNTGSSFQSTPGRADAAPQGGVSSQGRPSGAWSQDLDPLTRPGGEWRTIEIMAVDENGKAVAVNAGDAVDFMVTRITSLRQLLECVNAG